MELLEQQPPPKKIATDGPIAVVSTSSLPTPMQEEASAAAPLDNSDVDPSSSSGQIPSDSRSESRCRRDRFDSRAVKMSAILPQIWKDDLNSGKLLVSLFELFGEGILSFIPSPEMSLFL